MAEQKINYNDVFSPDFNANLEKTLKLFTELETSAKNLSKVKLKTDGGASAVADNEKALLDSLKAQKLLMDIEKKRETISKQQTLTLTELNKVLKQETRTISELEEKNKQLVASRKNVDITTEKGIKLHKELTKEIAKNQVQLNKYNDDIKRHQGHVGDYERALGGLKNVLAAGGIGLGLSAVFSELGDISNMIKNFDARIAELGAITGSSKEELEPLKQTILDLGATTKFTATQVAEASIELAKLGFTNVEIQQSLSGVLDGAVAMGVGIPQMAELASKSIRAFGLTTKDTEAVVSTFAASANSTATSFQYLNDSLPYAATAARTYGMSIEQTTALLGILADNGVKAESSGVALRDIFTDLATKGLTFEDAMAQINGSTNKAKTAFELFGKTSVNQSIIIANNIDKFEGLTQAITGQDKALQELVAKRLDTLEGSLQILESSYEGFILKMEDGTGATVKAARALIDFTSEILTSFTAGNAFTESLGRLFKTFGDLVNEMFKFYTQLIPVTKEVNNLNLLFEVLSLIIDTMPFNLIITGLKYMYEGINYLIDSIEPLNDLLNFTSEIFSQIYVAIKATTSEMAKLTVQNAKFGIVSKGVWDALEIAKLNLLETSDASKYYAETTDEATEATKKEKAALEKKNKELEKAQKNIEKLAKEEEKRLERNKKNETEFIKPVTLSESQQKELEAKIAAQLLNLRKNVSKAIAGEQTKGFDNTLMKLFGVDEKGLDDLYNAFYEVQEAGMDIFSEINSANQERTEVAISESEKRIDALKNEYETEKSLQDQRAQEGKAFDQTRLDLINKSIAEEEKLKLKQEEQNKKYQKRALLTQIISDEASSLSSAIVAAFGNPANKFTFGAAGIAQLAAMTIQLTRAFFRVRGALEKFEDGGMVGGELHRNGGTIIEAEKGEFITNRKATSQSAKLLDFVNKGKITDKHLNLLINPIPATMERSTWNSATMEGLLSEQNSISKQGFGKLDEKTYIDNGFRIVSKKGITIRYK